MESSTRILVVSTSQPQLHATSRLLRSDGYEVFETATGDDAVDVAREVQPDLIVFEGAHARDDCAHFRTRMRALPELQSALIAVEAAPDTPTGTPQVLPTPGDDVYQVVRTGELEFLAQIKLLVALKKTQDALRDSQETTRFFMNVPTDAAVIVDIEGKILDCNQTTSERFGLPKADVIGRTLWSLFPEDVAKRRKPLIDRAFLSGRLVRFEDERQGGWYDNVVQPIFDSRGIATKAVVIARDVTDRKQSEMRIDHLNAVLRAIRNVNQSIVREKNRDKLLQDACNSLIETRGYYDAWIVLTENDGSGSATPAMNRLTVARGTGIENASQCVADQIESGVVPVCVRAAMQHTGVIVLTDPANECEGCPLGGGRAERSALAVRLQHSGWVYGVLGLSVPRGYAADPEELALVDEIADDLAFALHNLESEAKRGVAEQLLHESEAKYRELFDRMSNGVIVYEAVGDGEDFIIRDLNKAEQGIGAIREADAIGRSVLDVFPGIHEFGLFEVLQRVWSTGTPEWRPAALYKDARVEHWVENYVYKLLTGEIVAVYNDVTAHKKLEEETESLARFPRENPNPVLRIAQDGTILYANPASQELLRVWERRVGDQLPEAWDNFVSELFQNHTSAIAEVENDGSVLALTFTPVPGGDYANAYALDITERRTARRELERYSKHLEEIVLARTHDLEEAQERLIRQERLAVLGQLAGGIGHELRNPLGVLSNAIYYLRMVLTNVDDTVLEYLDIMSEEIDKSEKIISGLLDFSRTRAPNRARVSFAGMVAQVLKGNPPPVGVECIDEMASDLPELYVDPMQIAIVVANLVTNAYQAMPKGGTLRIHTRREGGRAVAAISDSGYGIPQSNLSKVFEPLFTTKARGIGLGLALSRNLIMANDGTIDVASEEGKGTTFRLTLPLADDASGD